MASNDSVICKYWKEAVIALFNVLYRHSPVVLHGCDTRSLILREEHILRVFESRILRRIFGSKRDEVTGEWIEMHNGELHILYSFPISNRQIKSREMRWARHMSRMREERKVYKVLVGKPEGRIQVGRQRRR
jgi:hypothetical protein